MADWTLGQTLLSKGPIRAGELARAGISRSVLSRWVVAGRVQRLARGLYGLDEGPVDEHHSFLTAARQAPKAVGCLLTALEFHGLTTQLPREVWLALEGRSHQPVVQGVKVRFHRFRSEERRVGKECRS